MRGPLLFNALFNACLLALFLLTTSSLAQDRKTITIPFHSVNGLILLDVKVNGKASVMLMDTGANVTLLRNAPSNAVTVELEPSHAVTVSALDLERIGVHLAKRDMASIDGLLGEDFLRYFASVRIDYRNSVVEFEK